MNKKVYIVGGGSDYRDLFIKGGFDTVTSWKNADLLCFTGGTDVNPGYYHQLAHPLSDTPDDARDKVEYSIMMKAYTKGIPMVGICRGAQFLHVFAGGSLIQHVTHHQGGHLIELKNGETMMAAANHHQMMEVRSSPNISLLAVASGLDKGIYEGSGGTPLTGPHRDPEVLFHQRLKALCHQPHPEWMAEGSRYREWFFQTIAEYCFNENISI